MQVCGITCSSFPHPCVSEALTVCAVFSEGCYLEDVHGSMLLLHDTQYGAFSFGIGIHRFRELLQKIPLANGDPAVLSDHLLYFPGCQLSVRISVQAPDHPAWSAHSDEALAAALTSGKMSLQASGKGAVQELLLSQNGFQSPFAAVAKAPLELLSAALRQESVPEIERALLGLLGLGPGLTPSMDDFFMGVMALRKAAPHWNRSVPGAGLLEAAIVRLAPQRTNRYSAFYLTAMARGAYLSVFSQLLHGTYLLAPAALETLLTIGHNSGGDMLTGILWALEQLLSSGSVDTPMDISSFLSYDNITEQKCREDDST